MIKALAPGMRRGCSWLWLAVALAGWSPVAVLAQSTKGSADAKKDAPAASKADAAAAAGMDDEATANEAPEDGKTSTVEVFKDPNAEAALKVFKNVPGLKAPRPSDFTAVKSMAGGTGASLDRDTVQRFVQGMAYDLTDKTNLNALINPPEKMNPRSAAMRAVQQATDNLIEVFQTARLAKNNTFLAAYNAELLNTLPKLLDNNLVSRVQAMIVLGQTGNPNALSLYLAQLKNPDQTVWVKLWAARGLTNIVDNGTKVDTLGAQAIEAARTIADFLNDQDDLPWPVELRALEALGAMRQASLPNSLKGEMATTAMKFLADPDANPAVRAEAARALGLVRVNQAIRNYNYPLIAYDTGLLAAELGEKVNASIENNKARSEYLTALLVSPIYQTFNGMEGARESGLLKAPGNTAQAATRQIADRTAAVAKAAVELVRSPSGQIPGHKKALGDRVAELKTYLDKNAPKDYRLVPNGREFPPANAQVAKAPDDKPGVPGGPGR